MTHFLQVFIFIFIEYNMIVKQVFSTSRLQSHKFILANIEQTVRWRRKSGKKTKSYYMLLQHISLQLSVIKIYEK